MTGTGRGLHSGASQARIGGQPERRPHHLANALISVSAGLACLFLVTRGAWLPGAARSAMGFGILAAGPLVLWLLLLRWPRSGVLKTLEAFWLVPTLAFGHGLMGPLVDAVSSRLLDGRLAQLDLELFGFHPSMRLGALTMPWLTELAMLCYYTYFLWPLVLGVALYAQRRYAEFGQYAVGLTLFFILNFAGYALVPAVGPRYFLASHFPEPLEGIWLTPLLEGVMRLPPFARDCFPSGHTGGTLTVLYFAWKFERRVFAIMLLPAMGLILATLVGRFHYAVDLIAAIPVTILAAGLASSLVRLDPHRSVRRVRIQRSARGLGARSGLPA